MIQPLASRAVQPRARVVEQLAQQSLSRLRTATQGFAFMFLLQEALFFWHPPSEVLFLHRVNGLAILLAVVTLAALRSGWLSVKHQVRLGEMYLILTSAAVSLGEASQAWSPEDQGLSRLVLIVLLVPVLLPSGVRRALMICASCVLTLPLAHGLLWWLGLPSNGWVGFLVPFSGDVVAILAAMLPALTVAQLNEKALESYELGNYRLLHRLSEGGMGEVWVARHRLLKRPAAVKLTRAEALEGQSPKEAVERFQREAAALAELQGPHTVRVFDFGEDASGNLYLVMELLEGHDLEKLVLRFGPQPWGRVVGLLIQACRSLEEAHLRGLVHRDIKPANLFLTHLPGSGDFLKVLDFGLVFRRHSCAPALSSPQVVLGTPGYLSPEQISGKEVDQRSDIYSLGCVAFWLLTGQELFPRDEVGANMAAHLQETPPRASWRTEQDVPRELDRWIERCLQKRPEDRPGEVGQLRQELEQLSSSSDWTVSRAEEWWLEQGQGLS